MAAEFKVLMVCMGNICRSPLAQGVLEQRLRAEGLDSHVAVDSAGTGAWHAGEPPDPRGRKTATATPSLTSISAPWSGISRR